MAGVPSIRSYTTGVILSCVGIAALFSPELRRTTIVTTLMFAMSYGAAFGAIVTGVCNSSQVDVVRSLGADGVIDYTREDFAELGVRYDVILDKGFKTKHTYYYCGEDVRAEGARADRPTGQGWACRAASADRREPQTDRLSMRSRLWIGSERRSARVLAGKHG